MSNKNPHFSYCDKLKVIGKRLGFKTNWKDDKESKLYHLANPDCIWYKEIPEGIKVRGEMLTKIPVIVKEFRENWNEANDQERRDLINCLIKVAWVYINGDVKIEYNF